MEEGGPGDGQDGFHDEDRGINITARDDARDV
jgi:hypothetical protein